MTFTSAVGTCESTTSKVSVRPESGYSPVLDHHIVASARRDDHALAVVIVDLNLDAQRVDVAIDEVRAVLQDMIDEHEALALARGVRGRLEADRLRRGPVGRRERQHRRDERAGLWISLIPVAVLQRRQYASRNWRPLKPCASSVGDMPACKIVTCTSSVGAFVRRMV